MAISFVTGMNIIRAIKLSPERQLEVDAEHKKVMASLEPCTADVRHQWSRRPAPVKGFFIETCRACGAERVL